MQINLNDLEKRQNYPSHWKTCPSCNSVFLSERECEACGFILGKDLAAEVLDSDSFYTLREDFWMNTRVSRYFPTILRSYKERENEYIRDLLRRLKGLMKFFELQDIETSAHKIYRIEIHDLLKELRIHKVKESRIEYIMSRFAANESEFINDQLVLRIAKEKREPLVKFNSKRLVYSFGFYLVLVFGANLAFKFFN